MDPKEKANKEILQVLQKIKEFSVKQGDEIEYKFGKLPFNFEEEVSIINKLEKDGIVKKIREMFKGV